MVIRTEAVRTHQSEGHEWRELRRLSRGFSVVCECLNSDGKISSEFCSGLVVLNPAGKQVGVFKGHRFEAIESHDGVVTIFEKIGATIPCHQ